MTTLIIVLGVWLAVGILGIWVANHNPDELHDLAAQAKTGQVQAPRKGRRDAPILEPYSQYPGDMPVTYDPKYAPTRSTYEVPVVESFFDSAEYRAFVGGRDQQETPKPPPAPYHRPEPHVYQQAPYWSPERERASPGRAGQPGKELVVLAAQAAGGNRGRRGRGRVEGRMARWRKIQHMNRKRRDAE